MLKSISSITSKEKDQSKLQKLPFDEAEWFSEFS